MFWGESKLRSSCLLGKCFNLQATLPPPAPGCIFFGSREIELLEKDQIKDDTWVNHKIKAVNTRQTNLHEKKKRDVGFTKGEIAQLASRRTHPVKEELKRRTLRKFSLSGRRCFQILFRTLSWILFSGWCFCFSFENNCFFLENKLPVSL